MKHDDITGNRYGKLVAFERVENKKNNLEAIWKFKCDCGGERVASGCVIKRGKNQSCMSCFKRYKDLTGKRFGRLIVESFDHKDNKKGVYWKVKCDCGNETVVKANNLKSGNTNSCGCLNVEHAKKIARKQLVGYKDIRKSYFNHLESGAKRRNLPFDITIEYMWDLYKIQNGKCALTGIEINLYSSYKESRDKQSASLDRIDSSKGYTKDNVHWVHKAVNRLKNNYSMKDLLYWVKLLYEKNLAGGSADYISRPAE